MAVCSEAIREALEQQLEELELLESVFSLPGEFTADTPAVEGATAWVRRLTEERPAVRISCNLQLSVDVSLREKEEGGGDEVGESPTVRGNEQCLLKISMILPHSYPDEHPEIHISSDHLTRSSQDTLNSDLTKFVSTLPLGEVCLLNTVEWVRENIPSYYSPITTTPSTTQDTQGSSHELTFCRLWLYMHHIYSKTKRRDILDLAGQLNLTGFCLPGKPGIVCVEGEEGVTRHFFSVLRRWNWKSITCRHRDMARCQDSSDISQQRKLQGFCELDLVTCGPRQNHMDMGRFRDYLEQHGLIHVFPILFGVESHVS